MCTSSQSPARLSLRANELTESRSSSRVVNRTLLSHVRTNNSVLPFSLGTGTSRALLVVPGFISMYDAVKTSLQTLPCRSSWVRLTEKSSNIWYYRTAPSAALLVVPGIISMYDAVKTSLHTLPCRSSWVRPTEKSSNIWYYRTAPSAALRSPQQSARIISSWL